MKKSYSLLLILGVSLLAVDTFAQSKKQKKAMAKANAVTESNLRKHIGILASDSLEGRRTGTEGERKAVDYIVKYYTKLGISPAGTDGYLQPFEVDEGKVFGKKNSCVVDDQPLEAGKHYFPFAWSAQKAVKANSPIALQESGEAWWYDLKDDLISNQNNPHFMPEQLIRDKAKESAAKGATALLVINSSSIDDNIKYNAKDRSEEAPIPVLFFTREGVDKLAITQLSAPQVVANVAFEQKIRKGTNVVAFIDRGAAQTIAIGAHLDHLGYGEDANSRHTGEAAIHNGADDNASGTSAVLELARILKDKKTLGYNILLLHFSGEELGLYGSKYYVEHPTKDLKSINYMVNLDMVGRLNPDTKVLTVGGVGTSPAWSNILALDAQKDFTVKIDSSGTGPSDHTSFYRKDLPVLFFFTGLHTDYHKPSDDAPLINYGGEVAIVNYIDRIITATPPNDKLAFTKTREQSMGTGRFKVSIGIMPDYTFSGQGVKADGVIEGRPAQKAGLMAGDIIIQLGEHLITSVETYMQALNRFDKGQSTTVTIKRGNEVKEMPISF